MTIRILVSDDQALVRSGFRLILEAHDDLVVVGEAANGKEAVELARHTSPDVVLMDVRMPEMDGIEATREICAQKGDAPRVIMLTTFDIDEYVFDALRAGASGFVLKDVDRHGLIEAIRVVADGNALLAPSVTRRLIDDFARRPNRAPLDAVLDQLTARERETVLLVAQGLTNAEIAAELVVSEATVKTHVGHILTKLSARDRVQIVIAAYELGLVAPGE